MNYLNKTKKELVMMINDLPGPEVTMRPRKATLIEILKDRLDEADTFDMPAGNCADCDCTDCACEECDCDVAIEGSSMDTASNVFKVAIIVGIIAVLLSYLTW